MEKILIISNKKYIKNYNIINLITLSVNLLNKYVISEINKMIKYLTFFKKWKYNKLHKFFTGWSIYHY